MFEGVRVPLDLGEVREKGVGIRFDRNDVFPKWFARTGVEPTDLMRQQGFGLPDEVDATLYAWVRTRTGRLHGYVVYERETPFGTLPFAHTVPRWYLRMVHPDGETPY
ncbi:hypothetical protein UK23_15460 [Lentzea aerocolonigenes]|uniref:Uncharacterized protein n=1 Tax=Lentzea aerocolonigenes TaxID=68170 RepID=A0A0F0H063_LENAE|nr:hypothetical protein [Lentzea aerocolonigenes]KJK48920.1 hypothetical protein UK23_15460 [Lentzea aerocolonigenes]